MKTGALKTGAASEAPHIAVMAARRNSKSAAIACPICGKPTDILFRPFCSKRCADVDLHRWFAGSYAIPTEDEEDDERRDDSGETN